jgi:hypothetical protein
MNDEVPPGDEVSVGGIRVPIELLDPVFAGIDDPLLEAAIATAAVGESALSIAFATDPVRHRYKRRQSQVAIRIANDGLERVHRVIGMPLGAVRNLPSGPPIVHDRGPFGIAAMGLIIDLGSGEHVDFGVAFLGCDFEKLKSGEYVLSATVRELDLTATGHLVVA